MADDIPTNQSTPSETNHSFLRGHKKLVASIFVAISLVAVVAIAAVSLSTADTKSQFSGFDQNSSSGDVVSKTKAEHTDSTESNEIVTFTGDMSDFIVTNGVRSFSTTNCSPEEALWTLDFTTDNYGFETSWELYEDGSEGGVPLASGPPENRNYNGNTRYIGSLCLPAAGNNYYMKWYDLWGDGICCEFGSGEWSVSINGEDILQSDPEDSDFAERDFPFQITTTGARTGGEEVTGKFLIMPRPYNHMLNVELTDGTIYELVNVTNDFDYDNEGLVSGVSLIALPANTEFSADGTADMKGNAPVLIGQGASQLSRFEGNKSVLAVRVVASDGATAIDETTLSNSMYGNGVDTVNMVSQYKACSYGKFNVVKAPNRNGGNATISNGVVTISLPSISIAQGHGTFRNALTRELNQVFGVDHPDKLADYGIYCLPVGTYSPDGTDNGIAYAYINNWLSIFNDDWCESVSLQMHELGHNLNLGHSFENGVVYEDQSGIMGASYPNKNGPRFCFNAAKSWQTGWYRDKSITINSGGANNTCFDGILHGVADYPIATTVLLKIVNGSGNEYYVNFNARKGLNLGTQEAGNQVTVVTRPRGVRDSYAESELVAKLGSGETYNFTGYSVSVGDIDTSAGTSEVKILPSDQNVCGTN